MSEVRDTFAGPDGALGPADTGQMPTVYRGAATRKAGRGFASNTRPGSFVGYDLGSGGQDAVVSLQPSKTGGGSCIMARIVDANNWWRLTVRQYSYTYSTGTTPTEYLWAQEYVYGDPQFSYHTHTSYIWSTSNTQPPGFSGSYNHTHDNFSHIMLAQGPYLVGSTRGGQTTTAAAIAWAVRLERSVGGVVASVKEVAVAAKPNYLALDLNGSQMVAVAQWPDGGTTFTHKDATHASSTVHGWGYGESTALGNIDGVDEFIGRPTNRAPLAPLPQSPRNGAAIDRARPFRLVIVGRDPDSGDTITQTDWRLRPEGGTDWTVQRTQMLPQAYIELAGGTLAAGRWEWQAKTYDRQGLDGDWSTSEFLTAADATAGPVWLITDGTPATTNPTTMEWSSPDQVAYQVRTLNDVDGSPGTTELWTSGVVQSSTTRAVSIPFPVNGRTEHVELTVQGASTLWSVPVTVRRPVSYTPPVRALLSLIPEPARAALRVQIVDAVPPPGTPTAQSHDVWLRPTPGRDQPPTEGERIATNVLPSSAYLYRFPASDHDLQVRVTTLGSNGTTDPGDWTGASTITGPITGGNLYDSATYDNATFG